MMETEKVLLDRLQLKGMKQALRNKWEENIIHCKSRNIKAKDIAKCLEVKWNNFVKFENEKDKEFELDYPPIHAAVVCGDVKLFQAMAEIEQHFETVQIPDHENLNTPKYYLLFLAIELGHNEIAKFIMEKLKNRRVPEPFEKIRNFDQETPLHIAARCGNVELVEYFVKSLNFAHADFQDRWDNTPIHSLLIHYRPKSQDYRYENVQKILKCLIPKTDLSLKNVHTRKYKRYSALDLAIKLELKDAIEVLAPLTVPISKKTIQRCRRYKMPEMEEGLQNIRQKQIDFVDEIKKKEGKQTDKINLKGRVRKRCVSLNLSFSELASNTSLCDLNDLNETIKSEPTTIKYEPEGEEPPAKLSLHYDATNAVLFSKRSENNNLNTISGL